MQQKLSAEQRGRAIKLLKLCYTISVGLPGIPCVFYGDEAGVEGYHDPFNRRTYPWKECSEREADLDLIKYFSTMGMLRKNEETLKKINKLQNELNNSKNRFILEFRLNNKQEIIEYLKLKDHF